MKVSFCLTLMQKMIIISTRFNWSSSMTSWLKWAKILTRGLLSYSAEKLYQNPSPYNSTESKKNQFGKTRKKKNIHLFSAICIWGFFCWECYRIWPTTRLINRRLRSSSSFITLNKSEKNLPIQFPHMEHSSTFFASCNQVQFLQ